MFTVSRRVLLKFVAVAPVAAALLPKASFLGKPVTSSLPPVETAPGAIDAYLARTKFTGVVQLPEIRAEYLSAIKMFPLVLPDGWNFPSDPGLLDRVPGAYWQRGRGVSEAYMIWQRAVAAEALEGHQRGDIQHTERHLDLLERGYATEVRKAALEDPDNVFMSGDSGPNGTRTGSQGPLAAARNGDFAALQHFTDPR